MKIQDRIILLFIALLGLTLIAFLAYQSLEQKSLSVFFENRTVETKENFEKILELKGQSLKTFAYDYTYWDDMVSFVETLDPTWAKQNIETTLDSYNYDAIWIFNTNRSLAYAFSDNDALKSISVPQEALSRLFDLRVMRFFLNTHQGFLEINAATIHPTADKDRQTPPRGFLLVGKVWDDATLSELSRLVDGSATLIDSKSTQARALVSDRKTGLIAFHIPLFDYKNAPIMNLGVTTTSRTLLYQNQWSQKTALFFLAFAILAILVLGISTAHWISRPLALIDKALSADKPDSILPLKADSSEWGHIARLILGSIRQREDLVEEIKERKKAQEASKKLAMALEQTDDSVFITDKKGVIEYVNPAFENLTGFTKTEAIGATPTILRSGKHDKEFYDALYATIFSGRAFRGVLTNKRKDGHLIEVEATITPLLSDQGVITHFVSIDKDITEQKDLEKSQRLTQLGKLVSDISHEVNNPLQVISGHAEIALLEKSDNSEINESLRIIFEQCQRAKAIIQRVLQFSKPGKNEIHRVDITSSIDSILRIIEAQFHLANIVITKNYAPALPMILADEKQIQEVLMNLFNNARDAISGGGGSIHVTAQRVGQYVEVRVKDSGSGMDEGTLAHLPEPFFSTKEKGTGLGVHICHNIIRAHGGELRFESQKGIGTTAIILLPIQEAVV